VAFAFIRRLTRRAYDQGRAEQDKEQAVLTERLAAREAEIARLVHELYKARDTNTECAATVAGLRTTATRLAAELEAEREGAKEKLAVLEQAREQLMHAFQSLSAQALASNNAAFIQLATQTLGRFQQGAQGELEKRQQAIGELVAPVKQTLRSSTAASRRSRKPARAPTRRSPRRSPRCALRRTSCAARPATW
jgi:DNA recombination protein RmuC